MTHPSARDPLRRHWGVVARIACGVAAVIGSVAAISVAASAQTAPGTPPAAPNPSLSEACGLKVMLVLDESNSIYTGEVTGGVDRYTENVRTAANAFVDAMIGTGSPIAITAFHSFSRHGVPEVETGAGYTPVTNANVSLFTDWINNIGQPPPVAPQLSTGYRPVPTSQRSTTANNPRGTTNWQDAFAEVGRNAQGPPNLVVFMTDGDPNTINNSANASGVQYLGNNETAFQQAVMPAINEANAVKTNGANGGHGSRIYALGVGFIAAGTPSEERLKLVSGSREGTNPLTDDYDLASFADLKNEMGRIAESLCSSRLIIHKHVANVHGGPWTPGANWEFTANLTSPGHTWLEPSDAGTHKSARQTTSSNGRAEFHWTFPTAATAHLGVTKETSEPRFHFVEAICETHNLVTGKAFDRTVSTTLPVPGADVASGEDRTCDFYNSPGAPGNGGGHEEDIVYPANAPHLTVHKTMPAHAHLGDRVPITITVKNVGKGTAHDVVLHESRLAGLRIVHVANHGSLARGGTAVWHLGNLAHGASRTVHATALVTRTGLHPDTAVASASNADPAFSNAHVRAAAATRPPTPTTRPPTFTG